MSEDIYIFHRHYREGIFAAISAGFFFILLGMIFVTRPNLYGGLQKFVSANEWENARVGNNTIGNTTITLPAPISPSEHTEVYNAALEFCLAWGFFQVLLVAFRFIADSQRRRKARTISSVVFWFGAAYLINTYLNKTTIQNTWFTFWATIVMLGGVVLIVRATALALLE